MFEYLNQAFYGGQVDMYKPHILEGKLIYQYDVNSLYPYVMKEFKYPNKYFAHFIGDISNMLEYKNIYNSSKYVGFYKVRVTSPKNITHPILPFKVNGVSVYGEGCWTAWYYSEELNNAVKFRYNYNILEGYLFECKDLFSKYIKYFRKIKENAIKGSPEYYFGKDMQNSLFGKFALKIRVSISRKTVR